LSASTQREIVPLCVKIASKVTESKTIQFRGELFNIFNHANLGLPQNGINSPNFGQIQTSQPGRLVQFALKFLF